MLNTYEQHGVIYTQIMFSDGFTSHPWAHVVTSIQADDQLSFLDPVMILSPVKVGPVHIAPVPNSYIYL